MEKQQDHIDRINKVVRYIEQNLDQNLLLEDLARQANYSPFHFQRLFKSNVGETPKQYIKRVRLEGAAHHIALKPETSILEVALDYGFTSLEAFSRAFKNYYTVSPDKFRRSGEKDRLTIMQKKTISRTHPQIEPSSFLSTSIDKEEFKDLEVTVVKLPPQKLVYISNNLADMDTVMNSFKKVRQWAIARELTKPGSKLFALMLDYPLFTALSKCRYYTCIEVDKEPEVSAEINYMELPSRTYATFIIKGGINEMIKSTTAFAKLWLPESGYEIKHRPAIHIPQEDPSKVPLHKNTYQFYIGLAPK